MMTTEYTSIRRCTILLWIAFHKTYRKDGKAGELSYTAGSLLYNLHHQKMHMQDLTRLNGVSKSTATDYVDNLENKGYVRRVKDEDDRRGIYIEITDKGHEWVDKNEARIRKYLEGCASRLSVEELETFSGLFSKYMGCTTDEEFASSLERIMRMDID